MSALVPWLDAARSTQRAWHEALFGGRVIPDISAGISTALIAVPLNVALAVACQLPASVGLWTGAIAGVIGALFGSAKLQITGPEIALVPLTLAIVVEHGVEGLLWCTFMAGAFQIALGLLRVGRLIQQVPVPVILGFMAAVGLLVIDSQAPRLLGLPSSHVHDLRGADWLADVHLGAVAISGAVIATLWAAPKVSPRLPGPLLAIALAVGLAVALGVDAPAVLRTGDVLPALGLPAMGVEGVLGLLPIAIALALLASLDSLLASIRLDAHLHGRLDAPDRHRSDQELVVQGLANMTCGAVGGMPVAGTFTRSVAAVDAGATSRLAPLAQALALGVVLLLIGQHLELIPRAALAALLVVVGLRLVQPGELAHLRRRSPGDFAVALATALAILTFGFVLGILCGLGVALVRLAAVHAKVSVRRVPLEAGASVAAFRLEGPLHFGNAGATASELEAADATTVLVDLVSVPSVDVSATEILHRLIARFEGDGRRLVFCGARPSVERTLRASALADAAEAEDITRPITELIREHTRAAHDDRALAPLFGSFAR